MSLLRRDGAWLTGKVSEILEQLIRRVLRYPPRVLVQRWLGAHNPVHVPSNPPCMVDTPMAASR